MTIEDKVQQIIDENPMVVGAYHIGSKMSGFYQEYRFVDEDDHTIFIKWISKR